LPVTAASSVLLAFDFREIRSSRIRSSSSIKGLLIGSPEGTFVRVIPQHYSAAERSDCLLIYIRLCDSGPLLSDVLRSVGDSDSPKKIKTGRLQAQQPANRVSNREDHYKVFDPRHQFSRTL
jgi:hypothetical protein